MSVTFISAQDAMSRMAIPLGEPGGFSTIIDARSEDEYALDHLPGAVNWPSLNNEERIFVGTLYKQVNAFEAQKHGAAMVAANIARHIQREVLDLPKNWQPLIYCWRGGKRSGSLSLVLGQIGFKVNLIEGGYKAFRAAIVEDIPKRVAPLQFKVISGPTGSGKTRLLYALAAEGAQVLDLEDLASHRSSVLGHIPGQPQPSQKRFDTLVWQALRSFDPERPVFVESESRKVGNLSIPESLMLAMRESPCFELQLSLDERVALLMEDYNFFVDDKDLFCHRLDALVAIRGKAVVDAWKEQIHTGHIDNVVRELLVLHYDPTYAASMVRNFTQGATATACVADNRHAESLRQVAQALCQ
ncbi:tRNA 2-selenouridine(34) synthase MnmH [Limnohabitans sp. Rim8]|uniref:tRNA 2-selenouridine(34) synthase MnmH n=1 Tax=Limnohabitans sp. Rim8 TaxID=1100718 RepID=UPI000D3CA7B7|nr:tRNA 2-selenouridine(34) synthase MnmH [Limnohabitans sp. Rim8]PUE61057.1 tRNA 2-selenouridine(34) synthase MnmH [Limnohabitans sp. Rim8]